jgi:hypothetical protein
MSRLGTEERRWRGALGTNNNEVEWKKKRASQVENF